MGTPSNAGTPVAPGSPRPTDLRQKQIAKGRFLKKSAIAAFVIGIIVFNVFPYLVRIPASYVIVFNVIWIAVVIGVYVGATKLLLRGEKMMSASVEEALKADPRRPVLYLRSFLDDHAASKLLSGISTPWAVIFGEVETEEEMLAKILSDFGPLICIGKPGEEYPELGASRMYVTQEEWHEKVEDLIARASMVVLRLGQTEGFWWELEHSIQKLNPRALLVFVPYISDKTARDKIRQRAESLCPKPLPAFTRWEKKNGTVGSLRGIVFFDLDWTGHYVDLTRRAWTWKTLPRFLGFAKARATVRYALRPLYQQAGVIWKEPPVRWLPTIYLGSVLGIMVLSIIALLLFSGFHWLQDRVHRHQDVATNVSDPSVASNNVHSGDASTPGKSLSSTVRPPSVKPPSNENANAPSVGESRPVKPRIAGYASAEVSRGSATEHFNRGVTLQNQGQPRAAVTEYVASIAIDPSNAKAHGNLGVALEAMGSHAAAIAEYQTALHLNPNYPLAHYNLGLSLGRQGNRTQALVQYRAACSLEPTNELYCKAFRAAQSGAR